MTYSHYYAGESWDEQLMQVAMEIKLYPNPKVDYGKIMKKILSSEPPHAAELEAQIKFAKVWGGGKDQSILHDICEFIKLCEKTLKVSSFTFDSCSNLKVSPTAFPAQFIGACIKTIATRGTGRDGVGTIIGSKDIKQITGDKQDDVMKANQFMKKAIELCNAVPNRSSFANIDVVRGNFECDLVEMVFETFAEDDKRKTMTMKEIVDDFVKKICGSSDIVASTASSSNSTELDSVSNVFDATAEDAVHQALKHKGIMVGTLMQPRSESPSAFGIESQFEVTHINDDGTIGIQSIKVDGTLQGASKVVSMANIVDYQIVKRECRLKEFPMKLPVFKELDTIHRIVAEIAMYNLYHKHMQSNDMLIVQGAPKIRLLARSDIPADSLTLVPWSLGVQPKPLASKNDCRTIVEVLTKPPVVFGISAPLGLGKKMELGFWRMQEEKKDPAKANMKWSTKIEKVPWPVDIGLGQTVSVSITVAVNTTAIEPLQVIRVFTKPIAAEKTMKLEMSMTEFGNEKRQKKDD